MQSKRNSIQTILLLLVVALLLAACGRDEEAAAIATPTPLPAVAAPASAEETPSEGEAIGAAQTESPLQPESPLGGPDSPLPSPTPNVSGVQAAPAEDAGSVTGRLYIARSSGNVPLRDLIVGLAEVLVGDDGMPRASGYDPATPNRAVTDAEGGFAIDNVPPGLYSIILDAVTTAYQLTDPTTGDTIIVDVKEGGVFDIGNLYYETLPLPGFSEPQ